MRKVKCRLFLLGVIFFTSLNVFADESPIKVIHPIRTVTLWVKKYSELEMQLDEAVLNRNRNKMQQLLSDDFEERKGNNPNSPIPKEEWIDIQAKQSIKNVPALQQMAVRKLENIYIVSYLSITKENVSTFRVDVWKENASENQLMIRYSSQ
jgi:hypothetical protein